MTEEKKQEKAPRNAVMAEPPLPEGTAEELQILERARTSFRVGDYADVHQALSGLPSAASPAVLDAAADLRRRIAVDPVQIAFLCVCLTAIVGIAIYYLG